jgi:hypothetical protein
MTDATSGNAASDEDKRRILEEGTLAFRPDAPSHFLREPRPAPSQALADLAAAASIRRLTKHRRLIDGLRRSQAEDRASLGDQARQVLVSTLQPDLPEDSRPDLVDRAQLRLDEVVAAPGAPRLQPQHWQLWVQSTDDIYHYTTHEQSFEACNDEQLVMKATPGGTLVPSRLIIAQFWSDLPPIAFRQYVDPQNWPHCSPFWKGFTPLGTIVPTGDGYDGDFNEVVDIISETLTVPLHVGFRVLPDQSRVWTRFNISRDFYNAATEVDVDTGTVSAESVPGGPAPTLVQATKYLHWRDPSHPDLTAMACDFGWCELMEEMAYGCAQGFPTVGARAEGTGTEGAGADGAKTSVDAAIRQLVAAVTTECQQGISDNGPYLAQLIGRFTGSSWDAGWINDLLNMGVVTARRYGKIASDVRRFADALRDAAPERDSDG